MALIITLCYFFSLIPIMLTYILNPEEESKVPVFQPVASLTIEIAKICDGGETDKLFPFTQQSKNYVALSMTVCGFYIYDITHLGNPQIVFQNILSPNGKTKGITYSNITQYLWVTHSSGQFFGIDTTILPFSITVSGASKGNLAINKVILWPQDNNIIFLMCYSQFQIFDFRQPSQGLQYLQQVGVNGLNTQQIQFVRQNQFALVTVSNVGVQFYKVNNGNDIENISFSYSCVLRPKIYDVMNFQLLDENTILIMMQFRGIFLYDIKNYLDQDGQVCQLSLFKQITTTPTQGLGGQLYLSKDKKYLYSQFRSIGARIYDISQKTFQIVQNIFVDQSCNDITLNSSEDLLFYTNSLVLAIFERTTPNFNREVPNLLLNTFQIATYNFYKEDVKLGNYDIYCLYNEDKQQLYLARADYGVAAMKYSGQGILESESFVYRQVNSLAPSSRITFLSDKNTAYVTRISKGISIIDFTDPTSPVILKENITMNSPYVAYASVDFFQNFQYGLLANYINGYIISIADPLNPKILSAMDTLKYTQGHTSFSKFIFSKDNKYAFLILTTFGILTSNITDPLKPQIISAYSSHGCSTFVLFQDEQHGVIGATYEGVIIVKINDDKSLKKVSQLKITGSIQNLQMMSNDKYILASTYEFSTIILINIVDILNPTLVQSIGSLGAFAYYSICLSRDSSQVFITGQYYLTLLTLQNQIILHTQIYELKSLSNSKDYTKQVMDKGQSLRVGQLIEMHLTPIYQNQGILVRGAQYYFKNVLQPLPFWMTFQPSSQILSLSISKDSLQKNSQGQYVETIQQVVFQTYQQVDDSAFINNYLQIDNKDSIAIKNACMVTGYIDDSGFIQPSYTPSQMLSFGVNENIYLQKWVGPKLYLVKQFIQYILNQNIINYTTNFKISQSIQVNFQDKEKIIFTIQSDITVQLQMLEVLSDGSKIPTTKARFVNKSYPSVLILISSIQDQIKIEGSLENINLILKNGIKYSVGQLSSEDKILVQMTVSDRVNYDYGNTLPLQDLIFLSLQAPITISSELNLQKDLNSKYSGGQIFIIDNFQYQISNLVFTCVDSPVLQYSAQIKQGNQFVNIPKDSWIQFSPTDRVFSGNPAASQFNEYIVIQVNATDGYSFKVDQITIIPNRVPFAYAFQLAIQILGPLFGLLGFYKYKHLIYNLSFKNQYIYSKDVAYVGEAYRKQITITNNVGKQAKQLWEFFKYKLGESEIMYQLSQELMSETSASSYQYFSAQNQKDYLKDIEGDQILSFEEEVMIKMYPYGINNDEMVIVDKKSKNIFLENSQRLSYCLKSSNVKRIENQANEESQRIQYSTINNDSIDITQRESYQNAQKQTTQLKQDNNQKRRSVLNNISAKAIASNIKQNISMYDKIFRLQHLENNKDLKNQMEEKIKIFKDGSINISEILSFIKENQEQLPEKKRIVNMIQLQTLQNKNSLLSQAIYCYLVDYLIQQDKITKNLFDFMQSKACKYYLEIDWYKAYIDIMHNFEDIHTNPYPQFQINQKTLRASLKEIFRSLSRYYQDPLTKSPKEIKFCLSLLVEAIKSRAIGFSHKSTQFLQQTQGESLHTFNHLIQSIKAFEKNKDISCCISIHKCLDIQYIEKGLTDNEKLPSWIHSIDLINGAILISGVPEKKDIGSIIIKVIDNELFIIRSFQIQIIQKQSECAEPTAQAFFQNDQNDQQSQLQFQNNQANLNTSQIDLQLASQRMKSQKISVFGKSAIELQQNQIFYLDGNGQCNDENNPSFSKSNDNTFIDFNNQTIKNQEEKEESMNEKIATKSPDVPSLDHTELYQTKSAQQIENKPEQVQAQDQSFIDQFDQSKLGINKNDN